MQNIITITTSQFDDQSIATVNARELHVYLNVGRDFTNWIKGRIEKYGFKENEDYVITLAKTGERKNVTQTDYHISIDMAKELSMVENNEQGRQARRYFIECEKRSRLDKPLLDFENPAQLRHMLLETLDKQIDMQEEIKELTPQAEAYQLIAVEAEGSLCITNSAKNLQVKPKILFDWLSYNKWIYRRVGGSGWVAYQNRLQQGVLEHKITEVTRGDGSRKITEQVLVTAKGIAKLAEVFVKTHAAE